MIEPAVRLRTHVGDRRNSVTIQEGQELLEGVCRVTDREDGWRIVGHGTSPAARDRPRRKSRQEMRRALPIISPGGIVRPEGLEPPTLGSEDRCSIQLSYGRNLLTTVRFQHSRRRCAKTARLAMRIASGATNCPASAVAVKRGSGSSHVGLMHSEPRCPTGSARFPGDAVREYPPLESEVPKVTF